MSHSVLGVLCVRLASSRYPVKALALVNGMPALEYQLRGLDHTGLPYCVSVSDLRDDAPVIEIANRLGVPWFCAGIASETAQTFEAVRWWGAGIKHIIRLKTDELFYDARIMRATVRRHLSTGVAVTKASCTLDAAAAEVYDVAYLEALVKEYGKRVDEERGNLFLSGYVVDELGKDEIGEGCWLTNRNEFPMEFDTADDLMKIRTVLGALGPYPDTAAVIQFLRDHPEVNGMNLPVNRVVIDATGAHTEIIRPNAGVRSGEE